MNGADLNLRQLGAFVVVAETLHFGRAAQRLHLAQPAVSQLIRRLETALGTRLLDRDRRSTALTEAGRAFLPQARRTLAASADAIGAARAAAMGHTGRLRVGVAPSAAAGPVLEALRDLIDATPQLSIEVRELGQPDLINALRHDEIELAVGAVLRLPSDGAGISWCVISEEPFVLALPIHHPEADTRAPVSLAAFDGEPFISFARDDGPRYYDTLRGLLATAQVVPSREALIHQRSTQLALVAAGLGVALVPASTQDLHPAGVAYRPLRDAGPTLTTITAWRSENTNPVLSRTLTSIRRVSEQS